MFSPDAHVVHRLPRRIFLPLFQVDPVKSHNTRDENVTTPNLPPNVENYQYTLTIILTIKQM